MLLSGPDIAPWRSLDKSATSGLRSARSILTDPFATGESLRGRQGTCLRDCEGNAGSRRPDMFQQANNSQAAATLPRNCTIEESDWRILANFWHPVAFAHDVTDRPLHAKLLDVELVVYRTSGGIAVARDLCPHRGARLSLGRIANDRLVCPMHGLHFDHTGKCTRIP